MKMLDNIMIMTVEVNELNSIGDHTGAREVFNFDVTLDENIMNASDYDEYVEITRLYFENSAFFSRYADLNKYEYDFDFKAFR